uniref:Serine hydrolase n=1 Tax=Elaeophora elaphi TaxID=1147741 RepID=A0A0R3RP26_9BILA
PRTEKPTTGALRTEKPTEAPTSERPSTIPTKVLPIRYPGQAETSANALLNLHKSIHQALTQMLFNVGLNPTINYTIQGYEPDDVIIGTDISGGQVWHRNVGAHVVKDNIVVAFVNGSRYDKRELAKINDENGN